jgi:hypothetical protein
MAFDPVAQRIVLHGGENATVQRNDTWTWDGTSWREEASGPGVSAAAIGYDEITHTVILFGGASGETLFNDTWQWNGSTWSKLDVVGAPSPLAGVGAAWDSGRGRLVMFGGRNQFGESDSAVWEWDGVRWHLGTASGIGVLEFHSMSPALDGAGVLSFGGVINDPFALANGDTIVTNQVWRLRWDGSSAMERCSGTDADQDGLLDCDDPDCAAVCATCGNGTCETFEQCTSCPTDCGMCATQCGDFVCTTGESCAGDCQ